MCWGATLQALPVLCAGLLRPGVRGDLSDRLTGRPEPVTKTSGAHHGALAAGSDSPRPWTTWRAPPRFWL